ncbi:MAG: mechanosensitive ion channel domain-containing protein [Saprospiraceae bacterium]
MIYVKHWPFDNPEFLKFINLPIIKSILQFTLFSLSLNIIIRFLQLIYRKRKKYGDKFSDNVISGLQNIYYIIGFAAFVILLLSLFGVEPKELITALSILAASIAIITKDLVLDIICGIQLSFSKDLAIGDYVKIGDQKGNVLDLNINKIILHNDNDDIIYIPNSKAYSSELINYSQKELRKYNVEFAISTNQNISFEDLSEMLLEILTEYKEYRAMEEDKLMIISINKDEIKYKIQYKLNQVNPKIAGIIKIKIMNAILKKIQVINKN